MLRGRRLPVLAEIAEPSPAAGPWSLRRADLRSLEDVLARLDGQRVLLVTGEGEATTTVAPALAAAAAAAGRRTLLLECDLAEPRLARRLGLAPAPGLHEYLRWEAEPADVLQPLALAGAAVAAEEPLVCVCAGRPATDGETLLGLQSFAHAIEKLRAAYELVVEVGPAVDAEPASCVALAGQAEAMLAALPAGKASGREGRSLRVAIRRLPAPLLGAVAVGGP